MHFLLFYEVVADYEARRAPLRDAHIAHGQAAVARGELVLGGAFANPVDGAVLLFRGESRGVAEAFAAADPYVLNGLVTSWWVREWSTVVGKTRRWHCLRRAFSQVRPRRMGVERGGYTLRAATADDVDALVAFRVSLFEELGELPDSATETNFRRLTRESFSIGLVTGSCLAWLALASGTEPIGSAVMHLFPKLPSPANPVLLEGYLLNIYTVPAWRRLGVATALVTAALETARDRGLRRIRLHTTDEGRRVYEQAGFVARLNEMELML